MHSTLVLAGCVLFAAFGSFYYYWRFYGKYEDFNTQLKRFNAFEKHAVKYQDATNDEANLVWFLHLSDIHIDAAEAEHKSLKRLDYFCSHQVPSINPKFVLATGDLCDAFFTKSSVSSQSEEEWKAYQGVLRRHGLYNRPNFWIDIRGNHDAFDVPSVDHPLNLFQEFSVSKSYNFTRRFQQGNTSVGVIAMDACPKAGFNRFFNFFAYLTESDVRLAQENLEKLSDCSVVIGIGHYPMSLIQVPKGGPYAAKLSSEISLYLCGHLHNLLGPDLKAVHSSGMGESEVLDFKVLGAYRLISVDHGLVSSIDVPFSAPIIVHFTNPKDARYLHPGNRENFSFSAQSNFIRLLIFPIDQSLAGSALIVKVSLDGEEIGAATRYAADSPLWQVPWDPSDFSIGIHRAEAVIVNSHTGEVVGKNSLQFSIDGSRIEMQKNLLSWSPARFLQGATISLQMAMFLALLIGGRIKATNIASLRALQFAAHPKGSVFAPLISAIMLQILLPLRISRLVPSSDAFYAVFSFGIVDFSGAFYPMADCCIWYIVYVCCLFAPSVFFFSLSQTSPSALCRGILWRGLFRCWLLLAAALTCGYFFVEIYSPIVNGTAGALKTAAVSLFSNNGLFVFYFVLRTLQSLHRAGQKLAGERENQSQ